MDPIEKERRLLQKVVGAAALVPVLIGGYGAMFGASLTGDTVGVVAESHLRFLSGIFFAIGIGFWSTVPGIEQKTGRFRLLSALVFTGGLARLIGFQLTGLSSVLILGGMAYELLVTPALCFWQGRVANRCEIARTVLGRPETEG